MAVLSKSELNKTITNLQQQIDGAIETFTGSAVPTLSNTPANEWTTNAIRDTHVGDLYLVDSNGGDYAGFYYRFEKSGTTYQWTLLKDNEVAKALQDAKEANEKALELEERLKNYSTTDEMNSAINQTAEEITTEVNKQIEETVSYANEVATTAKEGAIADTNNKLVSYTKKTEMNTVVSQTAEGIKEFIGKNQKGWHILKMCSFV